MINVLVLWLFSLLCVETSINYLLIFMMFTYHGYTFNSFKLGPDIHLKIKVLDSKLTQQDIWKNFSLIRRTTLSISAQNAEKQFWPRACFGSVYQQSPRSVYCMAATNKSWILLLPSCAVSTGNEVTRLELSDRVHNYT